MAIKQYMPLVGYLLAIMQSDKSRENAFDQLLEIVFDSLKHVDLSQQPQLIRTIQSFSFGVSLKIQKIYTELLYNYALEAADLNSFSQKISVNSI